MKWSGWPHQVAPAGLAKHRHYPIIWISKPSNGIMIWDTGWSNAFIIAVCKASFRCLMSWPMRKKRNASKYCRRQIERLPGQSERLLGKARGEKGLKNEKRPPEKPSDRDANWISTWKMRGKSRISANFSHFYIKSLGRQLYQNWRPNMVETEGFEPLTLRMRTVRSPSWATPPDAVFADSFCIIAHFLIL